MLCQVVFICQSILTVVSTRRSLFVQLFSRPGFIAPYKKLILIYRAGRGKTIRGRRRTGDRV